MSKGYRGWIRTAHKKWFYRTQVLYATIKEGRKLKHTRPTVKQSPCYEVWVVLSDKSVLPVRLFTKKKYAENFIKKLK